MYLMMGQVCGLGKDKQNLSSHWPWAQYFAGPVEDEGGEISSLPLKEFSQRKTGCDRGE